MIGTRTIQALSLGLVLVAIAGFGALALAQEPPLSAINEREKAVNALQGRNRSQLARLLTVLVRFRRDPPPPLLVRPNDAVDAARAAILVKAITPELQRRARIYSGEAQEIARQRRLAAVANEAGFTEDSQAADDEDNGPVATVATITGETSQFELVAPKRLLPPLDGKVLHGFGDDLSAGGKSNGLTLATQARTSVYAPAKGLVQFAGPVKGWGVVVILRLTGGYHLVLAGLEGSSANPGEDVFPGAKIGWMPDGGEGPPQLYLEVRAGETPVNPSPLLKSPSG
ncbi:MAG: peptidase M24 [Alphaproteobacteria bacterium PA2]|nr:MAG: peptidase M24 [Alphaproteobacteria bacterium PA2]